MLAAGDGAALAAAVAAGAALAAADAPGAGLPLGGLDVAYCQAWFAAGEQADGGGHQPVPASAGHENPAASRRRRDLVRSARVRDRRAAASNPAASRSPWGAWYLLPEGYPVGTFVTIGRVRRADTCGRGGTHVGRSTVDSRGMARRRRPRTRTAAYRTGPATADQTASVLPTTLAPVTATADPEGRSFGRQRANPSRRLPAPLIPTRHRPNLARPARRSCFTHAVGGDNDLARALASVVFAEERLAAFDASVCAMAGSSRWTASSR